MFSVAPASFGASTLSNLSGAGALAGGAGGAATAGLGAALGPIGWAGLGLQAVSTIGSLVGGGTATSRAEEQLKKQREYQFGTSLVSQVLPRALDYEDTKREIALANSPGFRRAEGFKARQDAFDTFSNKYGPALAGRFLGSLSGS